MKDKGWLWICEVRSRFAGQANGSGGVAADCNEGSPVSGGQAPPSWVMLGFTKALQRLGFRLARRRVVNKMFIVLELQKVKASPTVRGSVSWPALKGCVYRKR